MKLDLAAAGSPKRGARPLTAWEQLSPYYAGFPEKFADDTIAALKLDPEQLLLDPWNGSGTTTAAAARRGLAAVGYDINPAMVLNAKARLLPSSETDSLIALAHEIASLSLARCYDIDSCDPLLLWFTNGSSSVVRQFEANTTRLVVGHYSVENESYNPSAVSALGSCLMVALFIAVREACAGFKSSNPTWLRSRVNPSERISFTNEYFRDRYINAVQRIIDCIRIDRNVSQPNVPEIILADSSDASIYLHRYDAVLTSPPYCTRIDYTAATRIELAVMHPLIGMSSAELSRNMLGTIRVSKTPPQRLAQWGETANIFLDQVEHHPSKASKSYYLKTFLDYYDKLYRSLLGIDKAINRNAKLVFVVQDSNYKEVHNNLPAIMVEMARNIGWEPVARLDYQPKQSMALLNTHVRRRKLPRPTEAVLAFIS